MLKFSPICGGKMKKIILDLCGGTGSWSRFYSMNGYDVRVITLPDYDVRTYEPPENVYGILAAPPCTEFSVAKMKWGHDFDSGMEIVNACLSIIEKCNPVFWALENPTGYLRKFLGKPKLTFQPWEYGDPWTKKTDIWGNFNVPEKKYHSWDEVPNKLPLYTRPNREKPSITFLHKSSHALIPQLQFCKPQNDAEFRAITPPGFAEEFFKANP